MQTFASISINFILMLRKYNYPYEYMDDWKKLNESLLPKTEKVRLYS